MTSLIQKLKEDALHFRKAAIKEKTVASKISADLLMTLLAEVMNVGKNKDNRETTEAEALGVLTKFLGGVKQTLDLLMAEQSTQKDEKRLALLSKLQQEQVILAGYVKTYTPAQLTADELEAEINKRVADLPEKNMRQMGVVMSGLKAAYDGRYDAALASALVKKALAT